MRWRIRTVGAHTPRGFSRCPTPGRHPAPWLLDGQMLLCLHAAAGMREGLGLRPGWRAGRKGDRLGQPGLPGPQHPEREGHGARGRVLGGVAHAQLAIPAARHGDRGVGRGAWHRPVFPPLRPASLRGTRPTQTDGARMARFALGAKWGQAPWSRGRLRGAWTTRPCPGDRPWPRAMPTRRKGAPRDQSHTPPVPANTARPALTVQRWRRRTGPSPRGTGL